MMIGLELSNVELLLESNSARTDLIEYMTDLMEYMVNTIDYHMITIDYH